MFSPSTLQKRRVLFFPLPNRFSRGKKQWNSVTECRKPMRTSVIRSESCYWICYSNSPISTFARPLNSSDQIGRKIRRLSIFERSNPFLIHFYCDRTHQQRHGND